MIKPSEIQGAKVITIFALEGVAVTVNEVRLAETIPEVGGATLNTNLVATPFVVINAKDAGARLL